MGLGLLFFGLMIMQKYCMQTIYFIAPNFYNKNKIYIKNTLNLSNISMLTLEASHMPPQGKVNAQVRHHKSYVITPR